MRTATLAVLLFALPAVAGCVANAEDDFGARPVVTDSRATFTVDRAPDMTYADLLVIANGRPFKHGPSMDVAQGWYAVDGKDRPDARLAVGDEIRIPLAGKVELEFRAAADGTSLQQFTLDVPDASPPIAPTPTSPSSGAKDVDRQAHFAWSSVDDASGVTYQVEYWPRIAGEGSAPPKTVTGLQGSTYSVPQSEQLLPAQTYEWHVRAVDGNGNVGPWSPAREFTTGL